ncbi:squamous cell carcinoma antigen recognized by T-cells 3 isoform X3 [Rosa chinensis]|uniref:squamous cell carcinoma antigen recognized by T-cells 3 isoform X3 n=1 Tax=Rosa chinensis TaxID=74649 RepID=UPI000D0967A6|nr:squamous cell carcinoma antigen recognized by T-cells 3 isoform X3 [Rosa chinensis]
MQQNPHSSAAREREKKNPIEIKSEMEEETLNPEPETLTLQENNNGDQPMLDAADQNPNSSSSDSDSDSGSGSDDEDQAQQNLEIQTLEAELATNPSNYDAHVQYIQILRKMADIEKLRRAREAMSMLLPLTPSMWQDWAKDELAMGSGPETFSTVEKLYEQGVSDYLSISLWRDYLNFVRENDPSVKESSPAGISKERDLFERALTAAGLHVSEGNKIWEAYREFEQAICDTIDGTDTQQAREKQIQRIRVIFQRQLSVPHVNMRSTLLAYKAWEMEQGTIVDTGFSDQDGISSHVAAAYQKALEIYNARVHFEEQISQHDMPEIERLEKFMNYLKFEQSSGDPARVQVLYERAIAEFPIASQLWLDYTSYLDKTLKVGRIISNVYSRAVKNCPWVGELWVRYLLSLERGHASEKEIAAVFYKSQQCTFSTLDEYVELFLTRIDGLRRRLSCPVEGEHALDYSLFRDTFQSASDYLSPQMKNTDVLLRLYAYWARLELHLGKDLVAARGVWESLLKISGTMMEAWLGYIAMEIESGHVNEARSIYRRCYGKKFSGTGSEDICYLWLRFEREFGSLDDFDYAERKVAPRLQELQLLRSKQESKLTEERENSLKKNVREKRKQASDVSDEQPPAKRQKDATQKQKKVHGKDYEVQNKAEQNEGKEMKAKGAKDVQNEMKEPVLEKTKVYADQCTAFVSNLSLKANNEHLHQFFSDVGGVVAIRILKDKFTGNSRGLAYVDFSDDAHLAAAIAKNKQTLLDRKLSIARSNPKRGKKEHGHTDQTGAASGSGETSNEPRARQGSDSAIKRKNTFAVPRNVAALGWITNKPKTQDPDDEKPKSNDEFRNMFLKG